jgi:hypothetical protein
MTSSSSVHSFTRRSQSLRSGFLLSRSINNSISPPERGFFGKLFLLLGSLTIFETPLATITSVLAIAFRQHIINTARVQVELNREYWEYHANEWEYKNKIARLRMKATVAIINPPLFTKSFIFTEKEGSPQWKRMTAVLKRFSPRYFEKIRDKLGDVGDLTDIDMFAGEDTIQDIDTYLFGPDET